MPKSSKSFCLQLLIPKERDNLEGVGDLVDEQINETAQLVADASARIEVSSTGKSSVLSIHVTINRRLLSSQNGELVSKPCL